MWKFRYRREHLTDDLLVDACNDLGEEGWSLVGAPRWDRDRQHWACFFKRTISSREQLQAVFRLNPEPGAAG